MPIEIRELEVLAAPQADARDTGDGNERHPEPGARQIERTLLTWHREMLLRADRLRAD